MTVSPLLGDLAALVRAMGILRPDEVAMKGIAQALGLAGDDVPPPALHATHAALLKSAAPVMPPPGRPLRPPERPDRLTAPAPTPGYPEPLITSLRPVRHRDRGGPARPVLASPVRPRTEQSEDQDAPPLRSLFRPEWEVRILIGLASTHKTRPELDVNRSVTQLATLEVMRRLPLLSRRRLIDNVHLLLDASPGMQPFTTDLRQLRHNLCRAIADWRVHVRFFAGTPLRGVGLGSRREWQRYIPPPQPAVVIIASDFGASSWLVPGAAGESEWLNLLCSLQAARHRVIGLTPYTPGGISARIRRVVPVVAWSRRTGVPNELRTSGGNAP
jgi:hypothetical protein